MGIVSCKNASFQQVSIQKFSFRRTNLQKFRQAWECKLFIKFCVRNTGQQRRMVETASYQIYQTTISTKPKIRIISSKNARPKFPARKLWTTLRQKYSTAKQRTVGQETYQSYQISIWRDSWMAVASGTGCSVFEFRFFSYGLKS